MRLCKKGYACTIFTQLKGKLLKLTGQVLSFVSYYFLYIKVT